MRFRPLLLLILFVWLMPFSGVADVNLENLKAAFIFKFAHYIEWPTKPGPFVIVVLNNQKLYESMKLAFDGKTLGDRKFIVSHVEEIDKSIRPDILHLNEITPAAAAALEKISKSGLLVITHSKSFQDLAIINFYEDSESRLKFEINASAASANDLKINSRLLNLSRSQK